MVSAVKFKNCVILNVTFRNSKVMGIDWSLAEKTRQLQFEDCVVSLTNLTFVRYADLRMLNCQAREVSFMDADCSGASFVGTDFEKCIFLRTNLTGADFRKARNYSIDISNSIIKKAIFSFPEAVSLLSGMDIILED